MSWKSESVLISLSVYYLVLIVATLLFDERYNSDFKAKKDQIFEIIPYFTDFVLIEGEWAKPTGAEL